MSTVRVTCLLCERAVEVATSDVVLHLEGSGEGAVDRYGFTCPNCSVYVVRRASEAVVTALLTTDVEVATDALPPWEAPVQPGIILVDAGQQVPHEQGQSTPHPERTDAPGTPPITEADVLLFRKALEDDAIMAAWLSG